MIYEILRRKGDSFLYAGSFVFLHYVYIFAKSFLISHVCAGQRESALFSFCGLFSTNSAAQNRFNQRKGHKL